MEQAHLSLAELLPSANVLRRFRAEGHRANIFQRRDFEYVEQVWVLRRLNCLLEVAKNWLLCDVRWAEVD